MIAENKLGIYVDPRARRQSSQCVSDAQKIGPYSVKLVTFALRHYSGMQMVRNNFTNNTLVDPEEMAMRTCAAFGIR